MDDRRSPRTAASTTAGSAIGRRRLIAAVGAACALAGCEDVVEPVEEADSNGDGGGDHYDIHEHGTLVVEIDGEEVDFSDDTYVFPDSHPNPEFPRFHFHEGSDDRWHMEADERLTFAEALGELPETDYERGSDGHVFTIEGETYDESDGGTSIETLVGDEEVDPFEYEIQDGDDLRVEVSTSAG